MIDLNIRALQDALLDMMDVRGIKAADIERAAKIKNVRRLAEGVNAATLQTWGKLYKAYPNDIPAPSYIDGKQQTYIKGAVKGNSNTVSMRDMSIGGGTQLTPQEATLLQLIREQSPDGKLTLSLIAQLLSGK